MPLPKDIVCRCCFVTETVIRETITVNGLTTVDEVSEHCNAGSRCGGCREEIEVIVEELSTTASGG